MKRTHITYSVSLFALLSSSAVAGVQYRVTDLGSLGDASSASGINDQGLAVGYAVDLLYRYHGFVSDGESFTQITPMGMTAQGQAMDINAGGQSIVASYMLGQLSSTALIVKNAMMMPMTIGSFMPIGFNDAGQVVGSRFVVGESGMRYEQACSWSMGTLTSLGQLNNGDSSIAKGVNDQGWAVGSAIGGGALKPVATVWINTDAIELGTLGGAWSQACSINSMNQVVGISHKTNGSTHAFRYDLSSGGQVTTRVDLGELGGGYSIAHDINDRGTIVGSSDNRAFIWDGAGMVDLNTMIDPQSGWGLTAATGINESGQIVGVGSLGGDPFKAFLLSPVGQCLVDLNADGEVDFFDISEFLRAFSAQEKISDWNGDGSFDFFDLSAFLTSFSAGCP